VTATSYVWNAAGALAGVGGWVQTTTFANNKTLIEKADLFGRTVYRKDLGDNVFGFAFDAAGRLASRSGGEAMGYVWFNTGKLASATATTGDISTNNWSSKTTTYGYDKVGNLAAEKTVDEGAEEYQYSYSNPGTGTTHYGTHQISWNVVSQNATAEYDALGRMTWWNQAASSAMPAARMEFSYDANGNIRRQLSQYSTLDASGSAVSAPDQDRWFRFDALGRVVLANGSFDPSTNQIKRGAEGTEILYDKAGQRKSAASSFAGSVTVANPDFDPLADDSEPDWEPPTIHNPYTGERVETYAYRHDGALEAVSIAQSGATVNSDGTVTVSAPPAIGALKASFTYDAMGRLKRQIDWLADGADAGYDRTLTYNAKGQVTGETVITKQGSSTFRSVIANDYVDSEGVYYLGALVSSSSTNSKLNSSGGWVNSDVPNTKTVNTIDWRDGAVVTKVAYDADTSTGSNPVFDTTYVYNASGALVSAQIDDGRRRTVTYTNDIAGQALRRKEMDYASATTGDPSEIWYRFGGKEMGYVGNNGTYETDYAQSITNRTRAPASPTSSGGAFRFGASQAEAEFGYGYDALNSYGQGSRAGGYTVRAGETLQSIAASLWGDASLWYKLAEANGLSASASLIDGQALRIPTGVIRSTHNAATFKPYDPAETLGDTNPTTPATPKPAKGSAGNKCGAFGQILLAVVAVAVTVVTAGAALSAAGLVTGGVFGATGGVSAVLGGGLLAAAGGSLPAAVAIGAASAAAGSIVSQGVGVATGIQQKFSWKGVGLAALSGAVTAGLGQSFGGDWAAAGARGAVGNAITQGIGAATGLQNKFGWAGVAAAGIGAAAGWRMGRALGNQAGSFGGRLATSSATAIANAATRSAITGESFADGIRAAIPDVIGQAIGNAIAGGIGKVIASAKRAANSVSSLTIPAAGLADGASMTQVAAIYENCSGGVQGCRATSSATVETSAQAELILLEYQDIIGFDGWKDNDFANLVNIREAIFHLRTAEYAALGKQYDPTSEIPFEELAKLGLDIPIVTDSVEALAYLVTLGEDGPGPRPALLQWNTLFDPLGTMNEQALHAEKYAFHRAYQSAVYGAPLTTIFAGDYGSFSSMKELQDAVEIEYQNQVDLGFAKGRELFANDELDPGLNDNQRLGTYMDRFARVAMRQWFVNHGVKTGRDGIAEVFVNQRLYDPVEGVRYRIPDLRVGARYFDASLQSKTIGNVQIREFFEFGNPSSVRIVLPTTHGQSYEIPWETYYHAKTI
jgi:hypothetical protein